MLNCLEVSAVNDRKIKYQSLGFSEDEINKMVRTFNSCLSISVGKIDASFNNLLAQGLNKNQIKNLLIHTPSILGMAINTVNEKLGIYKEAFQDNFIEVLEKNPRRMIQSADKARKRYEFLKTRGLSMEELEKDLFTGEKQFVSKYRVSL